MVERIRLWLSFKKNRDLRRWVQGAFTRAELEQLVNDITDRELHGGVDPFGPLTIDQQLGQFEANRTLEKGLYRRYGQEIWSLRLGGLEGGRARNPLSRLARLQLADQAFDPASFESFMVRNAVKAVAREILKRAEIGPEH